jgi:hypothetical protein
MEKGKVNGFLQNNFIAGVGKCPYSNAQCGDYAGCKYDPIRLDFPIELPLHTVNDGVDESRADFGVAVKGVLSALLQCFHDWFGRGKIHISDPHGDNIITPENFLDGIPLGTISPGSITDLVKIIFHENAPI